MTNQSVVLEGRGAVVLRDSDYVTSGGEGKIYRIKDTIVKIFSDTNKMKNDRMVDKIHALSVKLSHPSIIKPVGIVTANNDPVGFYMPFVQGESLPKFFITDFRKRAGFENKDAISLISQMRDAYLNAHDNGVILIDANELNYLVNNKFTPNVIDVDSWSPDLKKWPATVIMPSIRDWHSKQFNEKTDWFTWGIVTFQVMTGIHPYKGRIDGYGPGDLIKRMKDNVSVFEPGIRLPHTVRDFSCIPSSLLEWYRAEFLKKERSTPPSPLDGSKPAKAALTQRIMASGVGTGLKHELIFDKVKIKHIYPCGVLLSTNNELIDLYSQRVILKLQESTQPEVISIRSDSWLVAAGTPPKFIFCDLQGSQALLSYLDINRVVTIENKFYVLTDREMVELNCRIMDRPILTLGRRWQMNYNSTTWFDNFAIKDLLGSKFLVFSLGEGLIQLRAKELDNLTPLIGKFNHRFITLTAADRQGNYHKLEFTLNSEFSNYTFWQGGVDGPELNAVITPNTGILVTMNQDCELTIFVPSNGNINKIKDKDMTADLTLYNIGSKVFYLKDGAVWRVSTL